MTTRSIGRRYPELTIARSTRCVLTLTAVSASPTRIVFGRRRERDVDFHFDGHGINSIEGIRGELREHASAVSTLGPIRSGRRRTVVPPRNRLAVDNSLPRPDQTNIPRKKTSTSGESSGCNSTPTIGLETSSPSAQLIGGRHALNSLNRRVALLSGALTQKRAHTDEGERTVEPRSAKVQRVHCNGF